MPLSPDAYLQSIGNPLGSYSGPRRLSPYYYGGRQLYEDEIGNFAQVQDAQGWYWQLGTDPATGQTGFMPVSVLDQARLLELNDPGYSPLGPGAAGRDAAAQDLDRAQIAHLQAQDQIAREQIVQAAKEAAMNMASALYRDKLSAKTTAQGQQVQMAGQDDWRLLAALSARPVAAGPTPTDVIKSDVRNVANMELTEPNSGMDTATLEGVIQKMQGMNTTVPTAPFGMQMGGSFSSMGGVKFGSAKEGVLVGEERSGIDGSAEVAIYDKMTKQLQEIVPLAGGAAEGATFPSYLNAYQPYMAPSSTPTAMSPAAMQSAATPNPYAYGNVTLPAVERTPEGAIKDLNLTVMPEMLESVRRMMGGRLGYGTSTVPARPGGGFGQVSGPITVERGLLEAGVNAQEAARLSAQIGNLPSAAHAAGIYWTMNPAEQRMFLSLYKLAGYDADTFKAQLESAMIRGTDRSMLVAA